MKTILDKFGPLAVDIAERTLSVYVITLVGLIVAGGTDTLNVGGLKAAALAAVPAAFTALKGLLASKFGDPTSASFLK